MGKKIIFTKNAPGPLGPYSQAVEAQGFLFLSGQIPTILGDIKEQAREVLNKIKAILEEVGYNLDNVGIEIDAIAMCEDRPRT